MLTWLLATFKLHLCVGVRLQSSYLFIGANKLDFLLSISAQLHSNKQQWLRGLNEINLCLKQACFSALVLLCLNVTLTSVYTSNQVLRLHEKVYACRRSQ